MKIYIDFVRNMLYNDRCETRPNSGQIIKGE